MPERELGKILDQIEKLLTICLQKVREIRATIRDPELLKRHFRELAATYLRRVEDLIDRL